jgi:PAS domain S-box-containing protein
MFRTNILGNPRRHMTKLLAPLPPDPPSVGRARRLVTDALVEAGCDGLLDVAVLLTSEVVTNAVLHAGTELELRVRCDEAVVRIEVADGSPVLPSPRDYDAEASTGRGLGLVARLAADHGAERIEGDGKVVWFDLCPGADAGDDDGGDPEALLDAWAALEPELLPPPTVEGSAVQLLGVPVHLYRAMRQHNEALLREQALRGADGSRPTGPSIDLGPVDEAVRVAADRGAVAVDVVVDVDEAAAGSVRSLLDVLARADEAAAAGQMLTPPALPEVRWCRVWHLQEIACQLQGSEPTAWAPADVHQQVPTAGLAVDPARVLDALGHAVVVGDAENRVVFANQRAGELLGWHDGALVGERLTVLIPERLRERHLAGYTRMLVDGGRPRILGTPTAMPARRRDGSEVEVELLVDRVPNPGGRPAFVACLRELDP